MWGESGFLSPFSFFSSIPFGAIFNRPKTKNLKYQNFLKVYVYKASKKRMHIFASADVYDLIASNRLNLTHWSRWSMWADMLMLQSDTR